MESVMKCSNIKIISLRGGGGFKKNLMKSPIVSKIFILKSHWFIVQLKRVNIERTGLSGQNKIKRITE